MNVSNTNGAEFIPVGGRVNLGGFIEIDKPNGLKSNNAESSISSPVRGQTDEADDDSTVA